MALFGLFGRYEVRRGASSVPDWRSPRHANLDDAIKRADEVDGYVLDMTTGWDAIYYSRGYQKKYPLGQGGGGQSGDGVDAYWMNDPFEAVD